MLYHKIHCSNVVSSSVYSTTLILQECFSLVFHAVPFWKCSVWWVLVDVLLLLRWRKSWQQSFATRKWGNARNGWRKRRQSGKCWGSRKKRRNVAKWNGNDTLHSSRNELQLSTTDNWKRGSLTRACTLPLAHVTNQRWNESQKNCATTFVEDSAKS